MKRTDFTRSRVKEFSEVRDDDRPHLSRKSDAVTFSTRSKKRLCLFFDDL